MLAATGYFLGGDSAGLLPVPMAICAALRPPLSLLSGSSFSTLWVSLILLPGWTWWVFVMNFFSLTWSHFTLNKCSNITWGLWNLSSPATWMFVQLLVMAKNNDIKDPHYWLVLWKWSVDPPHKGPVMHIACPCYVIMSTAELFVWSERHKYIRPKFGHHCACRWTRT